MKHKKIKVLLSVLVVAVMCVGGTWASLRAYDTPAVNTFELAQVGTDIEEGGGSGEQTAESKDPIVRNNGKSPVYVRARVNLSNIADSDITIQYNTADSWQNGNDGFWYYTAILNKNEATTPLFTDIVIADSVSKDAEFDVFVYQESILATPGDTWTLAKAQQAFAGK